MCSTIYMTCFYLNSILTSELKRCSCYQNMVHMKWSFLTHQICGLSTILNWNVQWPMQMSKILKFIYETQENYLAWSHKIKNIKWHLIFILMMLKNVSRVLGHAYLEVLWHDISVGWVVTYMFHSIRCRNNSKSLQRLRKASNSNITCTYVNTQHPTSC